MSATNFEPYAGGVSDLFGSVDGLLGDLSRRKKHYLKVRLLHKNL